MTTTWRTRAACRGLSPALFFPARGESTESIRAVCRGCTVQHECLEYAMAHHERQGFWGGKSERERRELRRQRRAAEAA